MMTDSELQEHIHNIGLLAFLNQLERTFERAYKDTANFDQKIIPMQYSSAYSHIMRLRKAIFPANGDPNGKD